MDEPSDDVLETRRHSAAAVAVNPFHRPDKPYSRNRLDFHAIEGEFRFSPFRQIVQIRHPGKYPVDMVEPHSFRMHGSKMSACFIALDIEGADMKPVLETVLQDAPLRAVVLETIVQLLKLIGQEGISLIFHDGRFHLNVCTFLDCVVDIADA